MGFASYAANGSFEEEEGTAMATDKGFTLEDIAAIERECPNTGDAYQMDKHVLKSIQRHLEPELIHCSMTHENGVATYHARVARVDCRFAFSYVDMPLLHGKGWRVTIYDEDDAVVEIRDSTQGDWERAIIMVKADYCIPENDALALSSYELRTLLAGTDWELYDDGTLDVIVVHKRSSERVAFTDRLEAWLFVADDESRAFVEEAVGNGIDAVSPPAGVVAHDGAMVAVHAGSQGGAPAERYTVKVKGTAGAYAIDGGAFEAFAAFVELARIVSKAEGAVVYVRDNADACTAIAFHAGEQLAAHHWYGYGAIG